MSQSRKRILWGVSACLGSVFLVGFFLWALFSSIWKTSEISEPLLASQLGSRIVENSFPDRFDFNLGTEHDPEMETGEVRYTLDPLAQENMAGLIERYKPDFAAFVALEAQTGKILTLNSYQRDPRDKKFGNLCLKAIFPTASVFKVVTAAAVLDSKKMSPNTVIAFNGSSHTLYKRNVAETKYNRWTRYISVRDAFAHSINTVFGKLGVFHVGPKGLLTYAERFQFDKEIQSDLPFETGEMFKPDSSDKFEIAEVASGFNTETRMSPLHGSMIASAIVNDGIMMKPYIVEMVSDPEDKSLLYTADPQPLSAAIKPETANSMKDLMNETIMSGTSRKSFRQIFRRKELFDVLDMGGKTGSLTADEPKAKVDWFVGYASYNGKKIAVAALTANKKFWTVKSSYLAASYFDHYFRDEYPARRSTRITRPEKRTIASTATKKKKQKSNRRRN